MYELRILNGLHRGAALPLGPEQHTSLTIGASDNADVVMVDHGVADEHAVLTANGDGWLLSATGGALYMQESRAPQSLIEMEPGSFARLGDIWVTIAREDASWQAPPAGLEPDFDALADQGAHDKEPGADAHGALAAAPAVPMPDAGSGSGAPTAAGADKASPAPVRRRRSRLAMFALPVAAMLVAATAYALTSKPSGLPPVSETLTAELAKRKDISAGAAVGDPFAASASASASAGASAGAVAAREDNATLARLFRKRLSDAELLNRFDLTLDDQSWSMQAQLDDEETARFERVLSTFIKEHNITFPVKAKAVTAEGMLPFKIGQVITGNTPSLVTQDGARLYVGDDYRGVRVVAISANRLTFFGKRKIEVNW
jgi:type III secretion protein D